MRAHCAFAVEEKVDVLRRGWIVVNPGSDGRAVDDEAVRPFGIDVCCIESPLLSCDTIDFAFHFREVLTQPRRKLMRTHFGVAWAGEWRAVGDVCLPESALLRRLCEGPQSRSISCNR